MSLEQLQGRLARRLMVADADWHAPHGTDDDGLSVPHAEHLAAAVVAEIGDLDTRYQRLHDLTSRVIDDMHAAGAEVADELRAERDRTQAALEFVGSRYLADGSGVRFAGDRCTGRSSDALAWYGVGIGPEPDVSDYPHDVSDLAACWRTYGMAPAHVQTRMRPVLDRYQEHLNQGGTK